MHRQPSRVSWWWVALAGGIALLSGGCDPTVRQTVEDGIISVSTGLFGAFLRALIELGQEAAQGDAAAQALTSVARGFLA